MQSKAVSGTRPKLNVVALANIQADSENGTKRVFILKHKNKAQLDRSAVLRITVMIALLLLLAQAHASAALQQSVHGTVKDRAGAVVVRAQIVLQTNGQEFRRVSQPDGSFLFGGVDAESGTLTVTAAGFAPETMT